MGSLHNSEVINPVQGSLPSFGQPLIVHASVAGLVDGRQSAIPGRGGGHTWEDRPGLKANILPILISVCKHPPCAELVDHMRVERVRFRSARIDPVVAVIGEVAVIRRTLFAKEPWKAPRLMVKDGDRVLRPQLPINSGLPVVRTVAEWNCAEPVWGLVWEPRRSGIGRRGHEGVQDLCLRSNHFLRNDIPGEGLTREGVIELNRQRGKISPS